MSRNVGYLRVSTVDQDTEKFKHDILAYANSRKLGHVEWCEEKVSGRVPWKKRQLFQIVNGLKEGDSIIVPELSRLGRSLFEVLEVLKECSERGVTVFGIKENGKLNGTSITEKVTTTMLALFADIERDLISIRTKEALAARKKEGVKLGRPIGSGKSKLDPHRTEIESMLKNGVRLDYICKKYGIKRPGLTKWLRKHGLDKIEYEF